MKIKPKEVKRTVGILTDPQPNWTALVDHGANQTPWNSVKRDQSSKPPASKEKKDMAVRAGKGSKRDPVITRLTFQKSLFATTADVTKWMADKGFEGFNIVDDNDAWAAKSTEDYSKLNLSKSISTPGKDEGVLVHLAEVLGKKTAAELADEEDDEEDDSEDLDEDLKPAGKRAKVKTVSPAEKAKAKKLTAQELRDAPVVDLTGDDDEEEIETDTVLVFPEESKKFDMWGAYMSESGSLMGVLKDGMGYDGIPPGVDEVLTAVYLTTGNILTDEEGTPETKGAALRQLGEDYATLVLGLDELFSAVADDKAGEAAKTAKAGWLESLKRASEVVSANVIKGGAEADEEDADEALEEAEEEGDGEETVVETKEPKAAAKAKPKVKGEDSEVLAFLKKEILPQVNKAVATAEEAKRTVGKMADRQPTRKSLAGAADDLVDSTSAREALTAARKRESEEKMADYGGYFGRVGGGRAH